MYEKAETSIFMRNEIVVLNHENSFAYGERNERSVVKTKKLGVPPAFPIPIKYKK